MGRCEVLEGPTGRRGRPDEAKARLVAESFEDGARVGGVARRYGLRPQQLTAWRRLARRGRLALPERESAFPPEAGSFGNAALLVEERTAPEVAAEPAAQAEADATVGAIVIEAGGVMVRLPGETPAARLAAIVRALGTP